LTTRETKVISAAVTALKPIAVIKPEALEHETASRLAGNAGIGLSAATAAEIGDHLDGQLGNGNGEGGGL